jgi:hypothetical protein
MYARHWQEDRNPVSRCQRQRTPDQWYYVRGGQTLGSVRPACGAPFRVVPNVLLGLAHLGLTGPIFQTLVQHCTLPPIPSRHLG